jgi:hypothetical protein
VRERIREEVRELGIDVSEDELLRFAIILLSMMDDGRA